MNNRVTCSCGWSWNKSDSSKKDMYVCHQCGKDNTMKDGGWLNKFEDVPEAQNGIEGTMGGLTDKGFNYNGAWGGTMQEGGYAPKTERKLVKKYVDPVQKRAIERAKKQGINTGAHNGPLDAIRHASSAAATSSILPSWANLVPGVLPLNLAATNIAGLVHEINSPNNWKERSSDLYNNFIGSIAGVLPISEENKHNLLIQAQKYNVLSNLGNTEIMNRKAPVKKKTVAPKPLSPSDRKAFANALQMGGSIPGSVGFTYARTQSPAPSNGPYAKKTKASAQRGKNVKPIDNSNITNEVINYTKEYMNSPMYKQMLSASAKNEDDANTIQLNRNLNLDSTVVNFPEKQRQYNLYGDSKSSGLVNIYPLAQRDNITGNVIAHEVSHSVDRPISSRNRIIPQSDIDLISEYSNSKGRLFDRFSKYTALPTETRAQLNNIRYDAKSSNLYDPFTEKVTPEILEKIKNSKTKNGYDDLKDVYSDDQIINLLNTISKNNQPSQEFPIAQNGMEMKYYQEGLDWKPKNISKDGGWLSKYEGGGIIEDDMGQWAHPGEITKINSNQITMQGVNYPVLGISDTGDTKMMQPGEDYKFKGKSVTEVPMMQKGGEVIKVKQPDGSFKTYNTDSEEYRKLYDSGNLMNYDKSTDTYFAKPLDEVVITGQAPEKGFFDQSISSFLNKNKDAGLLETLGSVVTYPLGLPQQAMMYGLTGKVQDPSEALDIENPYGAFAVNALADPTNLFGIGLADDALRLTSRASKFLTEETALRNASKINPWAYQYNLPKDVMYRGIGEAGMKDAIESGRFRANPNVEVVNFPGSNLRASKQFNKAYYSPKFNIADEYGQGYIAEVPKSASDWAQRYKGKNDWSQIAKTDIPTSEGRILQKDWLRGYKEVPTSLSDGRMSQVAPNASLLGDPFAPLISIGKETAGYLFNDKANKQAIAEGNQWLQNWIQNPATQAKIEKDLGYVNQRSNTLKDIYDLGYEQAKTFTPMSKEYPISRQLYEGAMHDGNLGISYIYDLDPYDRINPAIMSKPSTGSWISRNPKMSQADRTLTTVHEGTHDWTSDWLLDASGQKDYLLSDLDPKIRSDWELWRKGPEAFERKFGKKAAYDAYLADPTEQHARIMELRKYFNLSPEQTITPEAAQKMIYELNLLPSKKQPVDVRGLVGFLNKIDNDPTKLSNRFNRLWSASPYVAPIAGAASMATQKEQKNGGWLNKYE